MALGIHQKKNPNAMDAVRAVRIVNYPEREVNSGFLAFGGRAPPRRAATDDIHSQLPPTGG